MAVAAERVVLSLSKDVDIAQPLPPPLKWAGGKRWLVPHLLQYWRGHEDRRLAEPFAGGLAVTLGLVPRRALLNDANQHLISFYLWLQRGLDVRATGIAFANDRAVYARNRTRFNELIREAGSESAEAAALFYYLNRTGNNPCFYNPKSPSIASVTTVVASPTETSYSGSTAIAGSSRAH